MYNICKDPCQAHEVYHPVNIFTFSSLGGQDIHTLSGAHRGHRQSDVHAERGGVVRHFQPIVSEHMAKPRPWPGSHMAGWSESSRAWLNMTGCGRRPGGRRVYWNSVTFVAEQPAAGAQKEKPGNTADYLNLHHSPGLNKPQSGVINGGLSTVLVSHSHTQPTPAMETLWKCKKKKKFSLHHISKNYTVQL